MVPIGIAFLGQRVLVHQTYLTDLHISYSAPDWLVFIAFVDWVG